VTSLPRTTPAVPVQQNRSTTGTGRPRPRVIANFALTWDARISTRSLTPSDFSSPADKKRLLEIRSEGDAVLASATTVAADTMTMGLPVPSLRSARVSRGQLPLPLRVIWTRSRGISDGLRLFKEPGAPVVVFAGNRLPPENHSALERHATVRLAPSPEPSPGWVLEALAREHGVQTVVLEGGGTLFKLFLAAQCVDELCLTWCPRIFGGSTGITLTGRPGAWLPQSIQARLTRMEPLANECFTRWSLKYKCNSPRKH
jgi:5-amino-6-(5-phosphoribosylamino)uracil reductase